MKSYMMKAVAPASFLCLLILSSSCPALATEEATTDQLNPLITRELKNVVVVSRHGVRAPTQNAETLSQWSTHPWPNFGVPAGYLSERGFDLIKQSWALEAKSAPFVHATCPNPDEIQVIADIDERTVKTAEAILAGAYPGCKIPIHVTSAKASGIFNPLKARVCKVENKSSLAEKLTKKASKIPSEYSEQIAKISEITGVDFRGFIKGDVSKRKIKLKGGPVNAAAIAEILALEWGQYPGENVGWGAVDQKVLDSLMPLRVAVFSALNRDLEVARYRGSSLASKIIEALDKGPKYTFLVGHDTNLANLGAIFDLNWQLPGRARNENTPGGFLKFEKWEVNGVPELWVSYNAISPSQMHSQILTEPPAEVQIYPGGTSYERWKYKAKVRLMDKCVSHQGF